MRVYVDTSDWWVGLYWGPTHLYVCPLPCVVFRFDRGIRSAQRRAVRR